MASGTALYVGRFRLFHKGYLEVVKYILGESGSSLIIAVGAAEVSHREDNPFTGEERVSMIESALMQQGLRSKVQVIPIGETNARYEDWTQLVQSLCPPFQLVYSWSELAMRLNQCHSSQEESSHSPSSWTRSSTINLGRIWFPGQ